MIYAALASMIAIAIRPLVVSVANVEVKVGLSTEGFRGLAPTSR